MSANVDYVALKRIIMGKALISAIPPFPAQYAVRAAFRICSRRHYVTLTLMRDHSAKLLAFFAIALKRYYSHDKYNALTGSDNLSGHF